VTSPLIDELTDAFRCLPGVGPKSAERMVMYLLERDRDGGLRLAERLASVMADVGHCRVCRDFTEAEVCGICANPARDRSLICVVESPANVLAIEQTGAYRGLYFVLMGHLSPIDGIGPDDLGVDQLVARAADDEVREVLLAVNPTVEGEATAHYITESMKALSVRLSRLAQGIPLGGDLEYVDGGTLLQAIVGRRQVSS
jgi:recombination protein RecR